MTFFTRKPLTARFASVASIALWSVAVASNVALVTLELDGQCEGFTKGSVSAELAMTAAKKHQSLAISSKYLQGDLTLFEPNLERILNKLCLLDFAYH